MWYWNLQKETVCYQSQRLQFRRSCENGKRIEVKSAKVTFGPSKKIIKGKVYSYRYKLSIQTVHVHPDESIVCLQTWQKILHWLWAEKDVLWLLCPNRFQWWRYTESVLCHSPRTIGHSPKHQNQPRQSRPMVSIYRQMGPVKLGLSTFRYPKQSI